MPGICTGTYHFESDQVVRRMIQPREQYGIMVCLVLVPPPAISVSSTATTMPALTEDQHQQQ